MNHSARQLSLGVLADIFRGGLDGVCKVGLQCSADVDADTRAFEAVELACVFEQRGITTVTNGGKDRRDDAFGFFETHGLTLDERRPSLAVRIRIITL